MKPAPAIAWTVAGAMLAAAALESLPARTPAPMPLDEVLARAAAWTESLWRLVAGLLQHGPPTVG
jgi:hypothetical protein